MWEGVGEQGFKIRTWSFLKRHWRLLEIVSIVSVNNLYFFEIKFLPLILFCSHFTSPHISLTKSLATVAFGFSTVPTGRPAGHWSGWSSPLYLVLLFQPSFLDWYLFRCVCECVSVCGEEGGDKVGEEVYKALLSEMLTGQIVVTSASKIASWFCGKNGAVVISYFFISSEGHFMMYYSRSNVLVTWS